MMSVWSGNPFMNSIACTNNTKIIIIIIIMIIIIIIIIQKAKECLYRLECLPQNPSVRVPATWVSIPPPHLTSYDLYILDSTMGESVPRL